ncbi:Sec-independent protein translocase protein TatB [Helicobacter pullorum]|uniref:Sec-independent protein translocase protein TatB n=1 Tax=Helicobacter pullorum TaxID=35818 RepID=UPI000816855C|nr:Sec-independent protein translocase protein TatB [Helicobacter pullorum]OCR13667.1 twin arginine-targeting protein translocase TatB [Helicobacter pullorum]
MFGMGFFEILVIVAVAIIFLGPEKLPKALVDAAKFFKAVKKTMDEAKESLDKEVNLSKIKEEALAYKNSLTQGVQNLTKEMELKEITSLDLEVDTPKTHSNSISSEAKEQTNNHSIFGENGIEIKPATNKQSLNFKEEISQEAKNIQDTQKESEKKNV